MIPRGYTNNTLQQMQHEQIPGHPLTQYVPLATPITVNLRRVSLVGDQAGIGPGDEMNISTGEPVDSQSQYLEIEDNTRRRPQRRTARAAAEQWIQLRNQDLL